MLAAFCLADGLMAAISSRSQNRTARRRPLPCPPLSPPKPPVCFAPQFSYWRGLDRILKRSCR